MVIKGKDAYELLKSSKISIRDITLISLKFYDEKGIMGIEFIFEDTTKKLSPKIQIMMIDIIEFYFYYNKDKPLIIEDYKVIYNELNEEFYLSLDPDYSVSEKNNNDSDFVIAKEIVVNQIIV